MGNCQEKPVQVESALVTAAPAAIEQPIQVEGEEEPGMPRLWYLPFAGRGEICRLCAAAGGLTIEDNKLGPDDDRKQLEQECSSLGTLPVLKHGKLAISQSGAISMYILDIAPKFKGIPKRARAVDAMYMGKLEDIIGAIKESGFFDELTGGPPCDTKALLDSVNKWYGHLESLTPSTGFINGLQFPTGADCACLVVFQAAFAQGYWLAKSGVQKDSFPKLKALCERVAEADGIKQYLAKSTTFAFDPMNPSK